MSFQSASFRPAVCACAWAGWGIIANFAVLQAAEFDVTSVDLAALVRREASRAVPPATDEAGDPGESSGALAECLAGLAFSLEKAGAQPTCITAGEIGACLAWLDARRLAPEVCDAVRRRYVRENLYLHIAGSLVFSQFEQEVDEPISIRQVRDGATITGQGRLTGRVRFELAPSAERAAVRMLFEGGLQAGLRGSAGPIGFTMHNRTRLSAEKWLWADGDGVGTKTAVAQATSTITVNDLWSSFRGPVRNRVATRIGWKRVLASRPGSQRASASQARRDLEARFDAQAEEFATALEDTYADSVRGPLKERGVYPRRLQVSSTDTHLHVAATVATDDQLSGWTPPPSGRHQASLGLTMHESLVNNAAATTLAGRTISASELADRLGDWMGEVPPEFADVGGVTWSLTLADRHPLELRITDDLLRVVIRCQKITAGAEEFSGPLTVTAGYRGAIDGQEIVLRRQGSLELFAPGLMATKLRDGLTDAQDEVRSRFEMILAEELRMSTDGFPFEPPAGSQLVPTAFVARDGWLLLTVEALPTRGPAGR